MLYTGALLLAIGVLRTAAALRALEPALAAGATIVIGYGLAGRLLPGIVHLDRSRSAGGRLEQPITYWNAEGALAAVGLVLCARLAADRTRPPAMRIAAAAATAPLGAGVYLSYSRGAIAGAVLGLVVLVAAGPDVGQLRASALALVAGAAAAATAAALPGVARARRLRTRERDGAIALVVLVLLAVGARAARGPLAAPGRTAPCRTRRRLGPAARHRGCRGRGGPRRRGAGRAPERGRARRRRQGGPPDDGQLEPLRVLARRPAARSGASRSPALGAGRLPRRMAARAHDPRGRARRALARAGGRRRARPAGLLAFAMLICGTALAARRALRARRRGGRRPAAALLVWFLHASIDWDWQLPGRVACPRSCWRAP